MAEIKKEKNISTLNGFLIIGGYVLFLVIIILFLCKLGILKSRVIHQPEGFLTIPKMVSISNAIQKFYSDCGRYPDDSEGLEALIMPPSGLENVWKGGYLKQSDLIDSWHNHFVYKRNDNKPAGFDIISYGADGVPGGEGYNADIFND